MKKFWLIMFILGVGLFTTLIVAQDTVIANYVKGEIEKRGTQALGVPVTVERVKLQFFPPATVSLYNLRIPFKTPVDAMVTLPGVRAQISLAQLLARKALVSLLIDQPRVLVTLAPPTAETTVTQTPPAKPSEIMVIQNFDDLMSKFALGLEFKIVNGTLSAVQGTQEVQVKNLNVELSAPVLNEPWSLKAAGSNEIMGVAGLNLSLPWNVATDFTVRPDTWTVQVNQGTASLAGLTTGFKGFSSLAQGVHNWDASVNIPEISRLPVPPQFLPPGKWTGGVEVTLHADRRAGAPWVANGKIKVNKLEGNFKFAQGDIRAFGQVFFSSDIAFRYYDRLLIEKLWGQANLTGVDIAVGNLFNKPSGIVMEGQIDAKATQQVVSINEMRFSFHTLKGTGKGRVGPYPGQSSSLEFKVNRTNLAGFEKFSPMLAETPLQGQMEVNAKIEGDFQKPESLFVNINPILLQNVKGTLKWESPDKATKVSGVAQVNSRAIIVAQGPVLKNADVNSQVDLTQLNIQSGEFLRKKAGVPLRLDVTAKQKGMAIEILKSQVTSSAGTVNAKGTVQNPQAPKLNLSMNFPTINFSELANLSPMLAPWKVSGSASGNLKLNGVFDFKKGIQASPLGVRGTVNVTMPEFVFKTSPQDPAAHGGGAPSSKPAKPEPLAPNWPIVRNADVQTTFKLGVLNFNDLIVKGITWQGRIKNGIVLGSASVQEVFKGQAKASQIQMSLLEPAAPVKMNSSVTNIDLAAATEWATPQWKNLISGKMTGNMSGIVYPPQRPDFLNLTNLKGSGKVTDGHLSTLLFDQFVNKKLESIPQFGLPKSVKTEGVKAQMNTSFTFAKGILSLNPFDILMPNQNEFKAAGWVRVADKTMELTGKTYLIDAPVQGIFKDANSDEKGRLMVPVKFSGSVFKPELHITDQTIKEMVGRTAQAATRQISKAAEKEVQKKANEVKKNLEQEAKKQLKGLFGQ